MNQLSNKFLALINVFKDIEIYYQKTNKNLPEESFTEYEKELHQTLKKASEENGWFTLEQISVALHYWIRHLNEKELNDWFSFYALDDSLQPKTIGLILAGNIPMVGFHDVLCVFACNDLPLIKLSSKDSILIPFILKHWKLNYPELEYRLVERLENYEAVIATGSDNSSTYFEYYFKNVPHLIRKNRTSLAVLSGQETDEDIQKSAKDIFTYYGLGCRNVTQLFLPKDFTINRLYENFMEFKDVVFNTKYANNYDYHKAIYLLNREVFWDNNFLLIRESSDLFSPIAVLYISYYEKIEEIENFLKEKNDKIQCVVSSQVLPDCTTIPFGETQNPPLNSYADGVDTIQFLLQV